ncbi:Abi family protein [Adlercreutzia sp. ZJ473]|uniref:Abi family protein n=1 Tax=Adlercreutzia sp. ZJ473 TaxID=2722822 RepID=UPI0015522BDE|nr:Abi family protein [Adlercreutzia sp. ZJ473]
MLDLYLWNIGLAQSVLRDASFFEVALRNAYDRAITAALDGDGHWLFDGSPPVRRPILRTYRRRQANDANRINRDVIDHLRAGLRGNATSDDAISNLTLGFWAHMTDRNHERDLWIPALHKVWPKGTSRSDINNRISEINIVRNRAAHHEHLFAPAGSVCSTLESCQEAVLLFSQLEPEAYGYIYGNNDGECSVSEFAGNNPAPCSIVI